MVPFIQNATTRSTNYSLPESTMSEPQVSRRDVERLFLQAILSRGVVSEKVAQLLRKKCIDAVNGEPNYAFLTVPNFHLSHISL
jgi:hypothetical protein